MEEFEKLQHNTPMWAARPVARPRFDIFARLNMGIGIILAICSAYLFFQRHLLVPSVILLLVSIVLIINPWLTALRLKFTRYILLEDRIVFDIQLGLWHYSRTYCRAKWCKVIWIDSKSGCVEFGQRKQLLSHCRYGGTYAPVEFCNLRESDLQALARLLAIKLNCVVEYHR